LGKQGDFKNNVLKVNIPRNDLKITIDRIATPTPFGFGSWLAMTKGDGGIDVMMGGLGCGRTDLRNRSTVCPAVASPLAVLPRSILFALARVEYPCSAFSACPWRIANFHAAIGV
jgi:hypothetical protein